MPLVDGLLRGLNPLVLRQSLFRDASELIRRKETALYLNVVLVCFKWMKATGEGKTRR